MIVDDLATLTRAMRAYYDRHLSDGRFTHAQARVLSAIAARPGATQAELAEDTRIKPPTMQRHLDELERAGLIVRSAVDGDRRKRAVTLTPAGEALGLRRQCDALLAEAVRGVDPRDLAITAVVLQQMEANLRAGLEK